MFPRANLPRSFDTKGKAIINERTAALINEFDGRIVKFKNLPREAQLAMAHYMAIDGEAWTAPDNVYKRFGQYYDKLRGAKDDSPSVVKLKALAEATFVRSLPYFVEECGQIQFGYIKAVPILRLIESVMQDADMKRDYPSLDGWKKYHNWYMNNTPKHKATSNQWPVILSCFPDETLQDGWTRFNRYAERKLKTCPALFYPYFKEEEK